MPECRYCGSEFDDEATMNEHILDAHQDELGPIDRRRLEDGADGGSRFDLGTIALVIVIILPLLIVLWLIFPGGSAQSGAATTPHGLQTVHYHGTISMVVDGQEVDLTQPKYVNPRDNPAFHFDQVGDTQWHVHAQGVTLEYAMATLGIQVSSTQVTFEGMTYDATAGDTVTIEVNGESVDPSTYVLQRDDHIRIVVSSS